MHGIWRLRDNEGSRHPGKVTISRESLSELAVQGNLELCASSSPTMAHYLPFGDGRQLSSNEEHLIWGEIATDEVRISGSSSNCVSLFNAIRRRSFPQNETWLFKTWAHGSTHVAEDTQAQSVHIEFGVLPDWCKSACPAATQLSESRQYRITVPEDRVQSLAIGNATLELHETHHFDPSDLSYRHGAHIEVKDAIMIGDILQKWVVPLYGLLRFATQREPKLVLVRVSLLDSDDQVSLEYPSLFASMDDSVMENRIEDSFIFTTDLGCPHPVASCRGPLVFEVGEPEIPGLSSIKVPFSDCNLIE